MMYAVVVRVTINDEESSLSALREQVVPGIKQAPGFIAGYWTRKGDQGLSLVAFESEEAAGNASERVRDAAPEGVTIEDVEVREVVASA
jgi:heme-degrading monooxygenase HmoA